MSSRSIPTEKLNSLLDAIQQDYPQWDGFSQSLANIFKEGRIDPKVKYPGFYSGKEPFLVISYTWRHTSLRELAAICDGTDKAGTNYFGRPLHLGKTTWIDVLFTPQFDLDASSETLELIVKLTAQRYRAAIEHLVVLKLGFLDRAWCLAELAVTTGTAGIRITVVGDWATVEAALAETGGIFYERMVAAQPDDVKRVREFALDFYGSPAAFNTAVHEGVVGKLKAAAVYNRACDHYYGDSEKGIEEDETAGRVLYEEAAALGHPEAQSRFQSLVLSLNDCIPQIRFKHKVD
jgi:hypothetical protein